MKQNMKKIWLVLCMALCLFVLGGCSSETTAEEDEIDPSVLMTMQEGTKQELLMFNDMNDDEALDKEIAAAEKDKNVTFSNALQAWKNIRKELGAFVSAETPVVTVGEDGYIAKMDAVYEKRNLEFTVMVDDNFTITALVFTPEYSMGEKMQKAGLNTLMGMGTVFVVLIFISWLISLFKYINVFENKAKKKAEAAAPAPVEAPAPAVPAAEEDLSDDLELVAVIAAAIAASEGRESTDGLVVRSIRRVPHSNWKRA